MPRHISFVFPGQGSQFVGMLNNIDSSLISTIKEDLANQFDFDLIDIINNGPEEVLNKTSITQPAILLASCLAYKQLQLKMDIKPDLMCGHSLGEFSALVASESIDLVNALKLVHKRGIFMENCVNGSMYAILNANFDDILRVCNEVENSLGQIVSPANINAPNQVVIAGEVESVESVIKNLNDMGVKRCIKLKVSAPSHCKLMNDAAKKFESLLHETEFKNPSCQIIHNYNAKTSSDIDNMRTNLVEQLTNPVQWIKTMNNLKSFEGIIIECGPGKILKGLGKSNDINDIISTSENDHVERIKEML